ncbi:MAG: 30S ribosomal protein S19 [Candidatus Aenigmarchaeota archaeon]|nr:30S ribosomal protein S19 [Candidatus Aenigmarchaeota archaeon]
MAKVFAFKGKSFEELKELSLEQFAKMITSRERRSLLKKGLTERQKKLLENIKKYPDKFHKTQERDLVIVPQLVGVKLGVHNGKTYVPVTVTQEMLGHRMGEFALTRGRVRHSAPGVGATRASKHIPLK